MEWIKYSTDPAIGNVPDIGQQCLFIDKLWDDDHIYDHETGHYGGELHFSGMVGWFRYNEKWGYYYFEVRTLDGLGTFSETETCPAANVYFWMPFPELPKVLK